LARLQKHTRNNVTYLYVVEDDYSSGSRKIQTIKSFGLYTSEKLIEAQMFVVNFNKMDEMARQKLKAGESKENVKKSLQFAGYLVLGLLGAGAMTYFLDKYFKSDS